MRKLQKDEGPDPIDRYVGTRIRGKRTGLRISQGSLGKAIGVTFQQIQKYESGANRVGASNLYKIAKTLGVDVSFFFEGVDVELQSDRAAMAMGLSDQPMARLEAEPMNSRHASELAHNYFRIADPQVRKRLFYLVRALVGGEPVDAGDNDDKPGDDPLDFLSPDDDSISVLRPDD